MRPPICAVCDEYFDPGMGDMVEFKKTAADLAWDKKAEAPGFAGHPPYLEWFCEKHIDLARELSSRTRSEAMAQIMNSHK